MIKDKSIISVFLSCLYLSTGLFIGRNDNLFAENINDINNYSINLDYLERIPEVDYIIGPGDELAVTISRDYEELDTIAKVDSEGTIYLPKLLRVYVQDLSINELNNLLNDAYTKYVKYPAVEVKVINYRPVRVYLKGELNNPGIEVLEGSFSPSEIDNLESSDLESSDLSKNSIFYFPTVFDAIRGRGGITPYSDLESVEVIRVNKKSAGGGKISTKLNFLETIKNGDFSQNIRVYDSDIIKINRLPKPNNNLLFSAISTDLNSKFIQVSVFGRVENPDKIKISKLSSLNDALNLSGGIKVLKGYITLIRFEDNGNVDKRKIRYSKRAKRGSKNNPILNDGDVIFVGKSTFNIASEVINEATSPFAGLLSAFGLYKALQE